MALAPQVEREQVQDDRPRPPVIPPLVTEALLPLLLVICCLGWAGYLLVAHSLHSGNPVLAFIFLGLGAALYMLMVTPLSFRAVDSAARTSDIDLPNAVALQTFSIMTVPTAALVIGWFSGGVPGLITGGIIGLVAMFGLILLMFRAPLLGALLTTLFGALWYVISGAGTVAAIALLAWILSLTGFLLPWHRAEAVVEAPPPPPPTPTVVASAAPAPPPVQSPKPLVDNKPALPLPKPAIVEPEKPKWLAAADPPTVVPAIAKWTSNPHQMIDVKPGATVVHSDPAGPFVAIVDHDACGVYDVRSGRRVGYIKQSFANARIALNPEGTYLAATHTAAPGAAGGGFVPAAPRYMPLSPRAGGLSGDVNLYSVAEGKLLTTIPSVSTTGGHDDDGFWFAGATRAVTALSDAAGKVLVVRELKLALPPHNFNADVRGEVAISPGGHFLAAMQPGRLAVFDLDAAASAGEIEVPRGWTQLRAMAFSPDGASLAAILDPGVPPWRLMVWDFGTGVVTADLPISGNASADWTGDDFAWLPDSKGVRVGADLLDLGTGRVFHTIQPAMAGTVPGRILRVLWPDQVVFEFLPTDHNSRAIYRGVPLPKKDIEVALTALRGPAAVTVAGPGAAPSSPPGANTIADRASSANVPDPAAAAVSTTGDPIAAKTPAAAMPAGTSPGDPPPVASATSAPAATKSPTAALAAAHEWTINVIAIVGADTAAIASQLQTQQERLRVAETNVAAANNQVRIASSHYTTESYTDRFGRTRTRNIYDDVAIANANAVLHKAEDERREAKQSVARLEREQIASKVKRTITGRIDDGTVIEVDVDTQAMSVVADLMKPDSRYTIQGTGRITDGILHVHPRNMLTAPAAAQ